MISKAASIVFVVFACGTAFGQTAQTAARFEISDIHVTPKTVANPYMEVTPPRDGRYEFHSASMINLIQSAYGFGFDRILGGPSWLEMDRFEVIAKVPAGTSMATPPASPQGTLPDAVREMLQSVLADRFKLVIRQETRPLMKVHTEMRQDRVYAPIVGKNGLHLKEAAGHPVGMEFHEGRIAGHDGHSGAFRHHAHAGGRSAQYHSRYEFLVGDRFRGGGTGAETRIAPLLHIVVDSGDKAPTEN